MTDTATLNEAAVEEAAKAICPDESAWRSDEQGYRDNARVAVQTYLARAERDDLEGWARSIRSISRYQMALRVVHELLDGGPGNAAQIAERLTEKNEDGCVFTERQVDDALGELDYYSLLEYPSLEDGAPVGLRALGGA